MQLLNIFALSTLAVLLCSFAPSQSLAVSVRANHLARQLPHHSRIVKKKRDTKRCKPRSSSSLPPSTPAPGPTSPPGKDDPPKTTATPKINLSPSSSEPPKSVSTQPPTTTPSGSGKLGIAWAMGNDKRFNLITGGGHVKIVHLWDVVIPDIVKTSGLPVSIMLWGTAQDKIDNFVKYAQQGYAKYAYGFNEPNESSQSNVDASTAAGVWNQYIRPLASKGYTLGSPATTSNPNGFTWVTDFIKSCGGSDDCGIDEITLHYYDITADGFIEYVNKWAGFGKPMRITEFACQNFNGGAQPSMDEVWAFTDSVIQSFNSDDRILSYAPFGFMDDLYNVDSHNALFTSTGLSDLGWHYVNA